MEFRAGQFLVHWPLTMYYMYITLATIAQHSDEHSDEIINDDARLILPPLTAFASLSTFTYRLILIPYKFVETAPQFE
jgi:hypothetical protein